MAAGLTDDVSAKVEDLGRRYADLVYRAAVRRMGAAGQDAEDVTQAVFLTALKKAKTGGLPGEGRMAGWLLKVTGYAVQEARRAQKMRRRHEETAAVERGADGRSPDPAIESPERESREQQLMLLGMLDDALLKLRMTDREVVVRRYLRGEPVAEVAAAVGLSENTAGRRIARALEKLRKILQRRGASAPVPGLVAVMLAESAKAAPATVAASAAGVSGSASAAAVSIAKGAAVMMKVAMAKVAAAVVCGILILGTGAVVIVKQGAGGSAGPLKPSASGGPATTSAKPALPGTVAAPDPVVAQDQLRARIFEIFCDAGGNPRINRLLADDWTDAIMRMLDNRAQAGKPPLTEGQLAALRGYFMGGAASSPELRPTLATHPLHYQLLREEMLKYISNIVESYADEAASRPKAIAQIKEMVDLQLKLIRAEFPNAGEAITQARGQIVDPLVDLANAPYSHSYKRPATDAERIEFEGDCWDARDSLKQQAEAAGKDPTAVDIVGFIRTTFLIHGYWDRVPRADAPALVAAQRACSGKHDEIRKYEAEQAKEMTYSANEEYVPALPLPFVKPAAPAAPEIWGGLNNGVEIRLVAAQNTFKVGDPITLEFQLRNQSDSPIDFSRNVENHRLEVDGVRYAIGWGPAGHGGSDGGALGSFGSGGGALGPFGIPGKVRPGHRSVLVPVGLNLPWRVEKGTPAEKLDAPALSLGEGEHKIRFIYRINPPTNAFSGQPGGDPVKEAASNTITIPAHAVGRRAE